MRECLEEFLRNERERAIVEPLPNQKAKAADLLKDVQTVKKEKEDMGPQEEAVSSVISLNWRSLAQKTAKKAPVRKSKPS
jgi:hypothetical protein